MSPCALWLLRQGPRLFARHYARVPVPVPVPARPGRKEIVRTTPSSILAMYARHAAHPLLPLLGALNTAPPAQAKTALVAAAVTPAEYEH